MRTPLKTAKKSANADLYRFFMYGLPGPIGFLYAPWCNAPSNNKEHVMTTYEILRGRILLLGTVALMSMTSVAFAQDALTVQQQGDIQYITGGIGTDERDQLEATKSDYNLHITNTATDGAFANNTNLVISDRKGTALVTAVAGPIFYAALPAGTYTISAANGDQQQNKTVKLGKGTTKTNLFWK